MHCQTQEHFENRQYIEIFIYKVLYNGYIITYMPQINRTVLPCAKKTRPTHRRTDANLYPPERQLTKASEPSFDFEGGAKGQI